MAPTSTLSAVHYAHREGPSVKHGGYAAVTHAAAKLEFATRLVVKSPVKRCGKSRLLDILECLVARPLPTTNISPAALVHSISEDHPPTIMLDEAEAVFGRALKNGTPG